MKRELLKRHRVLPEKLSSPTNLPAAYPAPYIRMAGI